MLQITIPALKNFWDEKLEEFINTDAWTLCLEHSLISISKWEGIFHKAFVGTGEKTIDEVVEYIKCMTVFGINAKGVKKQFVPDDVYGHIPGEELVRIQTYIDDDHTATFFTPLPGDEGKSKPKNEIVTSEVIYYYMISLQIPVQFEQWHLGRLLTLIKVCNEKNKEAELAAKNKGRKGKSRLTTKQQMDLAKRYHDINEARKKKLGTKG